jgi:hypothetical protein
MNDNLERVYRVVIVKSWPWGKKTGMLSLFRDSFGCCRRMLVKNRVCFLVLFACLLSACPGSRAYQPLPLWEAKFFAQAKRDLYPDDVRKSPARYAKTLVGWTGIIRQIEIRQEGEMEGARFTVEHRYFDWIEDHGAQREIFFLSPRGEGTFAAAWNITDPQDKQFIKQFAVGDMMVAYGYPSAIRDGVVAISPMQNMRSIKPEWYRADVLDYGRPGEPVKRLKVPF